MCQQMRVNLPESTLEEALTEWFGKVRVRGGRSFYRVWKSGVGRVIREELGLMGYWKVRGRGNAKKGFEVARRNQE